MIAPLAKLMDWSAIQIMWGRRLGTLMKWRNDGVDSRLDAAIQFLNGPDFIPAESQPARLEFTSVREFRFPTHGHASKGLSFGLTGRVLRWLEPRLEAGRKNSR